VVRFHSSVGTDRRRYVSASFATISIEGGARQQHECDGRSHGHEHGDERLVQNRSRLKDREEDDGAEQDPAGAPGGTERGSMHAFVEGLQAQQTDGADQSEAGAEQHQEPRSAAQAGRSVGSVIR
jgi:hypothetical protein